MATIVDDAIAFMVGAHPGRDEAIFWQITFIGEVTRIGTIGVAGDNSYFVKCDEGNYFFAADKVLFMLPFEPDDSDF